MANIKISELNELTKSQRAYNDYLAIVDSSANETKKISLENIMQNNIQLLAVTDTAPSECNIGDKYYNTETGLIYTAIEEDTWGTIGETPITDILYIVLEERTSYTYDGTDLVSVGGGAGSSVVVEPEEATEDTKLIIEEEDLDFTGLEISNEYNNANNMAYSCDYINEELNNTNKIIYANDFKSKNLVQSFKSGSSSTQYAVCLNAVADLKPNTTYTIQFKGANNHVVYFNEGLFTTNPRINCNGMVQSMTLTTLATLPTISSNGYAILKNATGNTVAPNFTNVQIELGEKATNYTKYKNFDNSGDILWSNSNPTDDFSNQTITLNSSDYDAYELIYARSKSQNIRYSTGRIPKGSSFNIFVFAGEESGGYLSYRYRNLNYVSDTSLSVSNCIQKIVNETTTGTANATCIPLYIIGYKTGLFN